MTEGMPPVDILLLNYGGTTDTLACLDSLQALDYPNYRIVVIDNASPDDSITRLKARLVERPEEFLLVEAPENLGYSGGNNLGIQAVLEQRPRKGLPVNAAAYVWLLNNDTTVDPHALRALVLEARRSGGLSGSLLLYPDGRYQQVGTRFQWWTGGSKGYPPPALKPSMPVETLSGASMLVPLRAIQQVGLLEESFFLYFEDGEFSLRCARAGFPLTVALDSRVYHQEGATTGRKSLRTQYYFHRNRLKLLFMYALPPQKLTIALYTAFRLARSVVKSKRRGSEDAKAALNAQLLGLLDFCRGVSGPCPHDFSPATAVPQSAPAPQPEDSFP